MKQERVFTDLSHQLSHIGVTVEQVECQMFIGNRINGTVMTWVLAVNAASSHAFELPGELSLERVVEITQAVILWDTAMMELTSLPDEIKAILASGAQSMFPCRLREMLIGN